MRYVFLMVLLLLAADSARADRFTYRDSEGERVTIEARLHGSGQGAFALEKADGQIELVPERAIIERVPGEDPKPLTEAEMVEQLTEEFGADRFRAQIKSPFVCGLVLAAPLSSAVEESRARAFLKKGCDFMKRIENIFEQFARQARLPLERPTYPLVLLVFETDEDFEKYALEITGGKGISAGNILGFYSAITNFLAIRMSECHTFETPLHEAIHQQVYNRNVLKRLAPLPGWYNEGIATGFEGNGDRITNGPVKVNSVYARIAAERSPIGWKDLVSGDTAFRGDIFAGDAYMHAWSMHWLLLNNYSNQYTKYVKMLGQKEPLAEESAEDRLKEFEEAFGKSPEDFQGEMLPKLKLEIKRQKVTFKKTATGRDVKQSHLAEVDFSATLRPQGILVGGNLTNISYIRDMAYYITIESGSGVYADWHIPSLAMKRSTQLNPQFARKRVARPKPGLGPTAVMLRVHSTLVDSETAQAWKRGQVPAP
jgi:hypothetical protein